MKGLTVLPCVVYAMIFLALTMFFYGLQARAQDQGPPSAAAVMVFENFDRQGRPVKLRIFLRPCKNEKVLERAREAIRPRLQEAELTWDGRLWASCWLYASGFVRSLDEAGDEFNPPHGVPAAAFRPEVGT